MRIALIFCLLLGCTSSERPKESSQKPGNEKSLTHAAIQRFIQQEYTTGSIGVGDSLEIRSLNATLYHSTFTGVMDGPQITLIREHSSNIIYEMYLPAWPAELDLPCDQQQKYLNTATRSRPSNHLLLGLEAFLNQSPVARHQDLSRAGLDSLMVFWWPDLKKPITDLAALDRSLDFMLTDESIQPRTGVKWVSHTKSLLHEKLKKENVLIYPALGLLYVEVYKNPDLFTPKGTQYSVVCFRIGFKGCPD